MYCFDMVSFVIVLLVLLVIVLCCCFCLAILCCFDNLSRKVDPMLKVTIVDFVWFIVVVVGG